MLRGPRAHDLDATESNAFDSQLTQASISSTAGVGGNRRRSSTADSTSSAAERADRKRAAYAVLLELDDKRKAKVKRFSSQRIEYDDDEGGSLSPKFDKLLQDRGPNGILRLTNFSPEEINAFWSSELRSYMTKKWNAGPGRKSEITAKDAFVMVLMSLKHCGNWDIVATACEEATSTFEHQVNAAFKLLHSFLYKRLVVDAEAKWNMHQLAISGRQFNNEHSPYYSATHKLHGMKVEVSVLPNGLAIHATKAYKGGVPDVNIFRENLEVHLTMLSKQPQDLNSPDEGPLREAYPSQWAVLADKGYQGLHQNVRAITPHKNPPRGSLSLEQQRENECISSDRVLVENYFGRMKSLWAIVGNKFRWTRTKLDMIVQLCVAFTNWHVRFHPLANADGEWHWQNERRLVAIGNAVKAKKLERQKRYREKRANRINRMLRSVDTLHSSDDDIDDDECSNQESFYETFDYA